MKPLNIGVLSKYTKLIKEIELRLPSANVIDLTPYEKSGKIEESILEGFEVVVVDFPLIGPYIYSLKNLKFMQSTWAGIDAIKPFLKSNETLNYPIYRFTGRHFGQIISEYVIASMINHERDFIKMYDNQTKCNWVQAGKFSCHRTIYDLTIGVMGIGQIGGRVAATLKFLGAKTLGLGRRESISKNDFPNIDEYYSTSEIRTFLSKCDYIINTLPNTNETKGMLDYPVLEACKEKQPVFINVGRGSIISDESLLKALENNSLSYAYLDVFNQEPLPENHPFWKSEKVKISPHIGAVGRAEDIAEQLVETLEMFQKNEIIPWEIDFVRGY